MYSLLTAKGPVSFLAPLEMYCLVNINNIEICSGEKDVTKSFELFSEINKINAIERFDLTVRTITLLF